MCHAMRLISWSLGDGHQRLKLDGRAAGDVHITDESILNIAEESSHKDQVPVVAAHLGAVGSILGR